jgi:hypothetical protein
MGCSPTFGLIAVCFAAGPFYEQEVVKVFHGLTHESSIKSFSFSFSASAQKRVVGSMARA